MTFEFDREKRTDRLERKSANGAHLRDVDLRYDGVSSFLPSRLLAGEVGIVHFDVASRGESRALVDGEVVLVFDVVALFFRLARHP